MLIDDTQHNGQERNTEDVIAVGEETCAGYQDGANVVPAEGRLVDLGEGKTTALVRVLDVREVIVEVVEANKRLVCRSDS